MLLRYTREFDCVRCGRKEVENITGDFLHDLRCWGLRTALWNACILLFEPKAYFEEA